jgi:hypothetical protein
MLDWVKKNLILCVGIVIIVIIAVLLFRSKSEKITQPSVLVNSSTAAAVARSAQDIARNDSGLTIRDYQLENQLFTDQNIPDNM